MGWLCAGIGNIFNGSDTGFSFYREVEVKDYIDGILGGRTTTDWTNDTSSPSYQMLDPKDDDRIYDKDAPGWHGGNAEQCNERYFNARQWITWNGTLASDQFPDDCRWYWRVRRRAGASPAFAQANVNIGNIALPAESQGCE
jgi:hypothetical protein